MKNHYVVGDYVRVLTLDEIHERRPDLLADWDGSVGSFVPGMFKFCNLIMEVTEVQPYCCKLKGGMDYLFEPCFLEPAGIKPHSASNVTEDWLKIMKG